jgi:hypothetical protein
MYIYDNILLNSSYNEKCFRHKLQRISKHTCYLQFHFSEIDAVYVEKYFRSGQATDYNMTRRMHFACRIIKDRNTHSEHVILISFPLQLWLHESTSLLPLYIPYLCCW